MPEIIEVRVRVVKKKLGDLVTELYKIPYITIAGLNVASYSPETYEGDDEDTPSKGKKLSSIIKKNTLNQGVSSQQQKAVHAAIEGGITSLSELAKETGVVNIRRVVNNLKKKKLVKGHDGSYVALQVTTNQEKA